MPILTWLALRHRGNAKVEKRDNFVRDPVRGRVLDVRDPFRDPEIGACTGKRHGLVVMDSAAAVCHTFFRELLGPVEDFAQPLLGPFL